MTTTPTNRGLFLRLFDREHFRSLRRWPLDALGCYLFATMVTPPDPYSALPAFVPTLVLWILFRYVVARRLLRIDRK